MQNNHVRVGSSSTADIGSSQCSCTECDSITCFSKRRTDWGPCACRVCSQSKSCLFYDTKIKITESHSLIMKDIEMEIIADSARPIKGEILCEFDNNKNFKDFTKKLPKFSNKNIDVDVVENRNARLVTEISRLPVANSYKEARPATEELSAQVMDVPYTDFQKSINKSMSRPRFAPNLPNLSPYDIFSRIKEAYKACSCKVCECIAGKSLPSDVCRCKPCECSDCLSFNRQCKGFDDYDNRLLKDYKEVEKGENQGNEFNCFGAVPYLQVDNFKSCNCEPCQCIECEPKSIHMHKPFTIAPIGEDISRRNVCQCSPCECFECARGLGLSTRIQNEMSTSLNRHPQCECEMCINEACIPDSNQFCSCARHNKVMSKPFQRDSNDYDIRRTNVTYDGQSRREANNYDRIAMFAAVSNNFLKCETDASQCNCDQCECLVCSYKGTENSPKVHKPIENYKLINSLENCKRSPSICQFCVEPNLEPPNSDKSKLCGCEVCECINCNMLSGSNIVSDKHETKDSKCTFSANSDCNFNSCDCAKCEKLRSSCFGDIYMCSDCTSENCIKENLSDEVVYPVKRGEKLTPAIFRSKLKDAFIESCVDTLEANEKILKQPIATKPLGFCSIQKTNPQEGCKNNASYERFFQERYSNHQMASHNFGSRTETVKHAHITKCRNEVNLQSKNFEPLLESNLSAYSSISESVSITPSRCKVKSHESSCNSSGHDYSNYLVHFPKATVETCLNDVIILNTDFNNDINLTTTDLSSKNNVRKFIRDPKIHTNSQSQPKEESLFEYDAQNFEDQPYKPRKFKNTSEIINKPKDINRFSRDLRYNDITSKLFFANKEKLSDSFIKDYKRVKNTLQEARAFSLQLMMLLEKYEKANREFESVSEKLKKSNDSILNKGNELKNPRIEEDSNKMFEMDQVPTKEQKQSACGSPTKKLLAIQNSITKINAFESLKGTEYVNQGQSDDSLHNFVSDDGYDTNEGRDESGDDIIKATEVLKTITEEREPIEFSLKQEKKKRVVGKFNRKYNRMYKRSVISSKRINSSTNSSSVKVVEIDDNPILKMNKLAEERRYFLDRNHTDKNIVGDFSKMDLPKSPEVLDLLKDAGKLNTQQRVSITEENITDPNVFEKSMVIIKQPRSEPNRQTTELNEPTFTKNNLDTNAVITRVQQLPLPSPLEKDGKASLQTIAKKIKSENATYLYENKALTNLRSEVKKLLDLPILQNSESSYGNDTNDVPYNGKKTSSAQTGAKDSYHLLRTPVLTAVCSRNDCDLLKVNFLNVRRVSDHTVLMKWNQPRVLNDVVGYELLVDGRAVQKILSPSRCMAVVTCLPHNDKVLLTVRTVLSTPCPHHSPATTVIYQPRLRINYAFV